MLIIIYIKKKKKKKININYKYSKYGIEPNELGNVLSILFLLNILYLISMV